MAERPETPQLDEMLRVKLLSEPIGQFVMEHLPEQGIVLARWMWEQRPCQKRWGRLADGSYAEISSFSGYVRGSRLRLDEVDVDLFDCPCGVEQTVLPDRPPSPYPHAHWSLVQLSRSDGWMNEQLARFFGLSVDAMDQERGLLLAWVRQQHTQEVSDAAQ